MKTLHTKAQQQEFLQTNWELRTIEHKWSTRSYGSSRIFNDAGEQIAKRTGCGYARFGAAIGDFIQGTFYAEVYKLAKATRNKKSDRKNYQPSSKFYGLFYDAVNDKAWLDGGCGESCMFKVLNAIGYDLQQVASCGGKGSAGSVFFQLVQVPRYKLEWLK